MNLLDILREDYARFPKDQTYSVYASDVLFKDPIYEFRGVDRYRKMITFIDTWFIDPKIDLYQIEQRDQQIETRWTLSWTAPLPWKPRMSIAGWSELELDSDGLIVSHVDYWHNSKLNVLSQVFRRVH
jgi:hypothetical protein